MSQPGPSRREFVRTSASVMGGAWLTALLPDIEAAGGFARTARAEGRPLAVLSAHEARTLEAAADRILPGGSDGPGATDAGAIHFVDRALDTFFAFQRGGLQVFLATLDARARRLTPGARTFADLPPDFQDAVLEETQGNPAFAGLRMLVVMAAFSAPGHGGNRDGAGWALMGFEDHGAYRPPFGHYDADAHDPGGGA